MREKVYVDRLFADYENTSQLKDFKEEITVNLQERVKEFILEGLAEDAAFDKATAELGDITAIADDLGKKKRVEAIGEMYVGAAVPMSKKTAAGIAAATGLLLFGVLTGVITYFATDQLYVGIFGASIFITAAIVIYVFAGLVRETAYYYAMKEIRAAFYALACGMMVFGIFIAAGLLAMRFEVLGSLGAILVFVCPSICALIFLFATEKSRYKPWFKAMMEEESGKYMHYENVQVDSVKATKFGVQSGGLWILAIALFITLGFLIGWKFSWLVFLFALAIQVFMVTTIFEKKK